MKTQAHPQSVTEPHSIHPTRTWKTGSKHPVKVCHAHYEHWAHDLLTLLKDSTLRKIVTEIIEGFSMDTIRKHCHLRMHEWRESLDRLRVAIKALWNNDGDAVLAI